MNPGSVQQGTNAPVRVVNSLTNAVVMPGQSSSSASHQKPHAILQPLQSAYPGQSLIVTIANHNGNESKNHDAVQQVIHQQNYNDYGQYVTVCGGNYYQGSGASLTSGSMSAQLVTQSGENYVVHGTVDGSGQIAHTIRASPATVQWLLENYETAESVSLPRSTLYNHYIRHCTEHKLDPMNPASFGKLIRSVFPGLRTRRLGTRGNSQYHYYGIRIKSMSPLNQVGCDGLLLSRQHVFQAKRFKSDGDDGVISAGDSNQASHSAMSGMSGSQQQQQQQHLQYLGDTSAALPDFGHVTLSPGEQFPRGVTAEHVLVFEQLYREHCEAFLEIIINLQFQLVETLWMSFWRKVHTGNLESDTEQQLPTDKLHALCGMPSVQQYVRQTDYVFYQTIVGILVPDVLRPIPSQLTQAIRNFAKNLEGWLKNALVGAPEDIIKIKVNAVRALAQILRRYTSLNHLAQAARAVLQNSNQITQMLADINKVDFTSVQEQASWVCRCDDAIVHHLEQDFKKTLQQQTPLEQWAAWLEQVVNDALAPYASSPDFPDRARQFLMKWSFYSSFSEEICLKTTQAIRNFAKNLEGWLKNALVGAPEDIIKIKASMVIRDLTLRSAASFGSFHLIRLLYDEYMFYIVEHKVAAAMQETSIAVMADYRQLLDIGSLSHEVTADVLLSTGPLSMTVDTDSLTPVTSTDADALNVTASSAAAAVVMASGRHLTK